jgi:hypothetical protein
MGTEYIGAKKIRNIRVEPSRSSNGFVYKEYQPPRRGFFGIGGKAEIREGYYSVWNDSLVYKTAEDVVSANSYMGLFIKGDQPADKMIWRKAVVTIEFKRETRQSHFESDQDAIDFAEEISKKFDHIKIKY